MKKRILIIIFIGMLIGVSALVYFAQQRSKNGSMYYSGTIEAIQSNLAFQASGHVTTIQAEEGKAVKKGQVLAELDSAEYQARLDQAKAGLDKAVLAKEQLEQLLIIFTSTLPDDVKRAEANVSMARNTMLDARKNNDRFEQLFKKGVISEKEQDTIKLGFENALSKVNESEAIYQQSRSNLKKIDTTKKDIESAQSQIDLAKATLEMARIQLGYTKLLAPYDGIITSRNVEPGEVVSPGREVLTMSDLSRVDLKIFVDETEIAKVRPGRKVEVKVDTFKDKVYSGLVSYVSPEAEFTPKIIQTKKERVKLVYLVKVSLSNPAFELKTGMPADAYLK
jgi:HlyD family secretion protein